MVVAGVAGLVASAMSMADGEYVSVSSQADTERADLERAGGELASSGPAEREELAGIYIERGLTPALAHQVADQLMAHDALGAHAWRTSWVSPPRSGRVRCRRPSPRRSPSRWTPPFHWCLGAVGGLAARIGGARTLSGAARVVFWGALAMGVTAAIGALFGTAVA